MKNKLYFYIIITIAFFVLLLPVSYDVFRAILFPSKAGISMTGNLEMYKWTAVGVVAFWIISRFFNKNLTFLETYMHETTHGVVALMFFKRIHSLHAETDSGVIYTSSNSDWNQIPLSLAPYCLPVISYPLLFLRCLIFPDMLWVFDIILGITIGFHINCFHKQTANYQTDINSYPLWFSYLYIWTARLFNIDIFLLSFWSSLNAFTAFKFVGVHMWDNIMFVYNLIF